MASNSEKQRALYRSREAAKANGALPAWYAAREAERATPVPHKSPERAAWDNAYASEQGLGPLSSKWELQGGKLTMVWLLPYNTGPSRPTPPR
jgi:hypothetical protein